MTKGQAAQAERDAENARANLEVSLDRLRSRFTPGSMLDEGLSLVRDGGVAQFARNLGRQAKDNPLPVALVGAGLAWLMLARRNRAVPDLERDFRSAEGDATMTDTLTEGVARTASRMSDGMRTAQTRAGEAYDAATTAAVDASDQVRHATDATMQRAARLQKAAGDRITTLMQEQPLALGALGLALGAVIGAALPRTDAEDRVMGTTSDEVKQGALDALQEQAGKAAQVAERVYDSAVQEGEKAAADAGWVESSQQQAPKFDQPQKPPAGGSLN